MRKLLGIIIALLLVIPFNVFAVSATDETIDISKYDTSSFKEILADEEIEAKFKTYSENDKQATIYLFRGHGCGFCRNFLTFLNEITDEYGDKFKVVGFEVWYDEENGKLMKTISSFLGKEASGVPYIVIGDEAFPGYASTYDDGIKEAITKLYNQEEKYDVFEEYNQAVKAAKKAQNSGYVKTIVFNALFTTLGVVVICFYVNKSNSELYEKLSERNTYKPIEPKKNDKKN